MPPMPPMETTELCDGEQPRKLAVLGLPWDTRYFYVLGIDWRSLELL